MERANVRFANRYDGRAPFGKSYTTMRSTRPSVVATARKSRTPSARQFPRAHVERASVRVAS
eukprot:8459956-Lingulodinium_polyedra.AAC.1